MSSYASFFFYRYLTRDKPYICHVNDLLEISYVFSGIPVFFLFYLHVVELMIAFSEEKMIRFTCMNAF